MKPSDMTSIAGPVGIVAVAAIVAGAVPMTRAAAQEPAAATYQVQLMGGVARRFAVRATLPSDGDRLDMAKSRPGLYFAWPSIAPCCHCVTSRSPVSCSSRGAIKSSFRPIGLPGA